LAEGKARAAFTEKEKKKAAHRVVGGFRKELSFEKP
jgi:hypothetical protein